MKISKGQIVELEIDRLAFGGAGIGNYEGLVVFVPYSAPGDHLRVEITKSKKSFLEARIKEILKPSPHRIEAPCEHFGVCGGCDFQHIDYTAQFKFKVEALESLLSKQLKRSLPSIQAHAANKPYNYRNRIQLNYKKGRYGYFQKSSKELIPVDHCMLAVDEINHSLKLLESRASRIEVAWNGNETLINSTEYGGAEGSFVQVNQVVNKKMQDIVVEKLQENSPFEFFVELYSGDGNFTIPILERFNPKGFSIEYNKKNVERAKDLLPSTADFSIIEDKVENFNHHFLKSNLEAVDHLLTDPPRSGMSEETLQQILRIKPKFIHYISCHPAALARDLKLLTNTYELAQIHSFDMFPQTGHLETYCLLRHNPEAPHDKLG